MDFFHTLDSTPVFQAFSDLLDSNPEKKTGKKVLQNFAKVKKILLKAFFWGNLFMMSIPPSIFFFDVLPSHFNPCRIFSSLHSIIPFPVGIVVAPCMVDITVIRPASSSTVPLYHRDFSSFVP